MLRQLLALPMVATVAINFISPALAQTEQYYSTGSNSSTPDAGGGSDYWTSQRLQNAKPMEIKAEPTVVPELLLDRLVPKSLGATLSTSGSAPTVTVTPQANQLFTPLKNSQLQVQPKDIGTAGAAFTSSRLIPLSADQEYPYRTIGKLFLSTPDGDATCSAAVIAPRLILTAGHCVHSGNGRQDGFYTNFLFVPAFRDGFAPLREWSGQYAITTGTWYNGGGKVPNAADYALIEIQDQSINQVSRKIGDVTGLLGVKTNSLAPNHATLLGYPCNIDSCSRMHQVNSESFQTTTNNTVNYGSDMSEGSSGGPWVQNFGVPGDGQTTTDINQIIGVTSYGPTDSGVKYQGSSILDSRFSDIFTAACSHQLGNCPN